MKRHPFGISHLQRGTEKKSPSLAPAKFKRWAGEGLLPDAADLARDRCPTEVGFGAAATAGDKITTKRFIAQSAVGGGARLLLLSAVFAARIETRGECKCLRQ